jgi:hypothetical protein
MRRTELELKAVVEATSVNEPVSINGVTPPPPPATGGRSEAFFFLQERVLSKTEHPTRMRMKY